MRKRIMKIEIGIAFTVSSTLHRYLIFLYFSLGNSVWCLQFGVFSLVSSVSTSHIGLFLLVMTIHSVFLHLIFSSFLSLLITVVRFKRNIKMFLLGSMNLKPNKQKNIYKQLFMRLW